MATAAFDAGRYKETTRRQWQDAAAAWRRWDPVFDRWLGEATELLLDLARVGAGSRVLDVAAGSGGQTIVAARRAGDDGAVLATDLASNILDELALAARAANVGNVATRVMDAEALDVDAGSFDAVVSRLGLMYLPDKIGALVSARQALRPGGRYAALVFAEADRNGFFSLPISIIRTNAQLPPPAPGLPGPFSATNLEELLADAGFSDVEVRRVEAPLRLSSAAECAQLERESFGALHQMLAGLSEPEQASTWQRDRGSARAFRGPRRVRRPLRAPGGWGDRVAPSETTASLLAGAPEGNQAARVQVIRRTGRDPSRARRVGRGRPERLREVERLRLDPLGDGIAQPGRAASREARRRALRRLGRAWPDRPLRGRPAVRQRRRGLARPAVRRGLGRTQVAARRRGAVPRQPHARAPDRSRRAAVRRRPRRRAALGDLAGPGRDGAQLEAARAARADRRSRGARPVQATASSRRTEARAGRRAGRARQGPRGRGEEAVAAARAPGDRRRAGREARPRDRPAAGSRRDARPRAPRRAPRRGRKPARRDGRAAPRARRADRRRSSPSASRPRRS